MLGNPSYSSFLCRASMSEAGLLGSLFPGFDTLRTAKLHSEARSWSYTESGETNMYSICMWSIIHHSVFVFVSGTLR